MECGSHVARFTLPSTPSHVALGEWWVAASCHADRYVRVWETRDVLENGAEPCVMVKLDAGPAGLVFGPGDVLYTLAGAAIQAWRIGHDDFECRLEQDLTQLVRAALPARRAVETATRIRVQHETSAFASLLAVCCGPHVVVVDTCKLTVVAVLDSRDNDLVEDCCFGMSGSGRALLLVLTQEETCEAWDIAARERIQCTVEFSGPPRAIAALSEHPGFAVGTADGHVHLLAQDPHSGALTATSDFSVRAQGSGEPDECNTSVSALYTSASGPLVVGFPGRMALFSPTSGHALRDALLATPATSHALRDLDQGLVCVSAACLEPALVAFVLARPSAPSQPPLLSAPAASSAMPARKPNQSTSPTHAYSERPYSPPSCDPDNASPGGGPKPEFNGDGQGDGEDDDDGNASGANRQGCRKEVDESASSWHVSIFPSTDPPENSPLRTAPLERKPPKAAAAKGNRSQAGVKDKPVTFHSRIKSSGYGSSPPVQALFGAGRPAKGKTRTKGSRGVGAALLARLNETRVYPRECEPISKLVQLDPQVVDRMMHSGAVRRVRFSTDGSHVISCSTDKTARVTRLPLERHKGAGVDIVGHHQSVNSVDLSYSSTLLHGSGAAPAPLALTGSADGTTKLWCASLAAPLATFATADSASVQQAGFFYLDRFVLASAASRLQLFQFRLDEDAAAPSKDLKSQQRRNRQKARAGSLTGSSNQRVVATWDCKEDAQTVTSWVAVNSFLSHTIITARSDRSLAVIDAAADRCARLIAPEAADDRVTHALALPTSSNFTSHPTAAFDMFVSSSTSGGGRITLWDLRARRPVQRLLGHKNRVQDLGLAISPCMRFVATGSEDNSCYIYDVRTGECVERLWDTHRDTVSDVAFHPLLPRLVTACFDGKLRFYEA